ncbi:MAG: DUF4912 domain-containing protein [Nitrospinae bacterium]|nr:DUF4912 domain-containing protein [Nitrospinota bacterium]
MKKKTNKTGPGPRKFSVAGARKTVKKAVKKKSGLKKTKPEKAAAKVLKPKKASRTAQASRKKSPSRKKTAKASPPKKGAAIKPMGPKTPAVIKSRTAMSFKKRASATPKKTAMRPIRRVAPALKAGPRRPSPYESTPYATAPRIMALLKDPKWAYCFWDSGNEQREKAAGKLGCPVRDAKTVVRVWDRTEPGDVTYFDIEPGKGAESYYIRLDQNKRYSLEIGFSSPKGALYSLAGTDVIQTPMIRPALRTIAQAARAESAAGLEAPLPQAPLPLAGKAVFLPEEEKEFLRIYALSHGVDESAITEGGAWEIAGELPSVFSY